MISYQYGYLNPQLESGPYAKAYMESIQNELGFPETQSDNSFAHYAMVQYMYNLSLDTANSSALAPIGSELLDSIGKIIGYPWPSVFNADFGNNFQFIQAVNFPGSGITGFSGTDVYGNVSPLNGLFTTANPSAGGNYLNVPAYVSILKFVAKIKWSGISIISIDQLLKDFLTSLGYVVTTGSYTIYIGNPNGGSTIVDTSDIFIRLSMSKSNIGVGYLYSLQYMFNKVCTAPQIQIGIY